MERDKFVNLNISRDSHFTNLYYNKAKESFSLSKVFEFEEFPIILSTLQNNKENSFDYLKTDKTFGPFFKSKQSSNMEDFIDKEKFKSFLMDELETNIQNLHFDNNELSMDKGHISEPFQSVLHDGSFKINHNSFPFDPAEEFNNNQPAFPLPNGHNDLDVIHEDLISENNIPQIATPISEPIYAEKNFPTETLPKLDDELERKSDFHPQSPNKRKASASISQCDQSDDSFTFRNLQNLDFELLNKYKASNVELESFEPELQWNFEKLLKEYFKKFFTLEPELITSQNFEENNFITKIMVNQSILAELISEKNGEKGREGISKLIMTFYCSRLVGQIKLNRHSRKKIKKDENYMDCYQDKLNGNISDCSFSSSLSFLDLNLSDTKNEFSKMKEEKEEIFEILREKKYFFSSFMQEMKIEIIKKSPEMSKRELNKKCMRVCLSVLHTLFLNYNESLKNNEELEDYYLLNAIIIDGIFKVTIIKKKGKENYETIVVVKNYIKVFALYLALIIFFQKQCGGNYKSINEIYDNLKGEREAEKNIAGRENALIPKDPELESVLNAIDDFS